MKKAKPLNELSLNELQQKKKEVMGIVLGLGIVMLIACVVLIYVAIIAKKPSLIAVAVCCSISFLPTFINLQKLNNEIKSRVKQ